MNEKGVDLDGALDWLAEANGIVLSKFQVLYRMLPSWGPDMDFVVTAFVERLAYLIRGHDIGHSSRRDTSGQRDQKYRSTEC